MKLYEVLNRLAKGKKIKAVDVSDKPDVSVETVVKGNEVKVIKRDYRGTHYLKDLSR